MMTNRIILITYIAILCFSSKAAGQWISAGGPVSEGPGAFLSVAAAGDTLFAGSYMNGGVYRSTDNGLSWAEILPYPYDNTITIQDGMLVVGSYYGIFISTDFGNTWSRSLTNPVSGSFGVLSVVSEDSLIIAGTDGGVYRSTDRGRTWKKTYGSVNTLAMRDSVVLIGTYNGIFRSTDYGVTWDSSDAGLPPPSHNYGPRVNAIVVMDGIIFAGTNDYGVYKSTDDGRTWQQASMGLTDRPIYFLSVVDGTLYTSPDLTGAIYASTDTGASWHIFSPAIVNQPVFGLTGNGNRILAATFAGIYQTSAFDLSWEPVSTQYPVFMSVQALSAESDALIASGTFNYADSSSGNTFFSLDAGYNWEPTDLNYPPQVFKCFAPAEGGAVLGGTWTSVYSDSDQVTLLRTTDGGKSWTPSASGLPSYSVNQIASHNGYFFAATGDPPDPGVGPGPGRSEVGGVFKSTDGGFTWTSDGFEGTDVSRIISCPGGIFVVTSKGVSSSTDDGTSWHAENSGLPDYSVVSSLTSTSRTLYAATYGGIYELSYLGRIWTQIAAPARVDSSLSQYGVQLLAGPDYVFAGTNTGVYLYFDSHWIDIGDGLPGIETNISSLLLDNGILYAGTGDGVWMRPLQEIMTEADSAVAIPSKYVLFQNYPNPFNPSTTISYQLSVVSNVTLKVYDVLGREIATLVDGRENPGTHTAVFDGSRFASGVYLYRLSAPGANMVRKMLLLK